MNTRQLWFVNPFEVEIRERRLDSLQPDQVLVKNLYSAVSSGTELLVYRGQLPDSTALDDSLGVYAGQNTSYPLQYGYACVGRIEQAGTEVDPSRVGATVFAFQPHAGHYQCAAGAVIDVPDDIDPRTAVFLANMETAVNLLQDGNPRLGERVVVIGQGIVGLLVSGLLAQYPLAGLYALDSIAGRRALSAKLGAHGAYSPEAAPQAASEAASEADPEVAQEVAPQATPEAAPEVASQATPEAYPQAAPDLAELKEILRLDHATGGADVVFELSGSPEALNLAVDLCGYDGRIVVGSWYGSKRAGINLGERFHRKRMAIVSSQVSTIAPELSGRWDKARRFSLAWEMMRKCRPAQFISHCLPFDSAAEAYRLLDDSPEAVLQVIFDYQA